MSVIRHDGRMAEEMRKISIIPDYYDYAEGSVVIEFALKMAASSGVTVRSIPTSRVQQAVSNSKAGVKSRIHRLISSSRLSIDVSCERS